VPEGAPWTETYSTAEAITSAWCWGRPFSNLKGQRLYDLKGIKVYKLSGELVGHLPSDAGNSERRLDKSTDKLFR
jgi:hypothetical protein